MHDVAAEVQQYLHRQIPLSEKMGAEVGEVSEERVVLRAPLTPNLNHRKTGFGGSISALAMLTGWTYVYYRLRQLSIPTHIVIQRNTMEFGCPVTGDFEAVCSAPEDRVWQHFIAMLTRKSRGRLDLDVEVKAAGQATGSFVGTYVAIERDD